MFSSSSLLSYILLAVSLTGALASYVTPEEPKIVTLPFKSRSFASDGSVINLMERDAARLQTRKAHLKARMDKRTTSVPPSSFPITDVIDGFTAQVSIGSPATVYNLLIDTRSGNTWLGADTPYKKTSTSKSTGKQVSVTYDQGQFTGVEYTDTVWFSPSLWVTSQSIGVATSSSGFSGVDGILGLGPVASTAGTVKGASTVPTVADNLYSQGKISTEIIGIKFFPTFAGFAETDNTLGELTFGGVDPTMYTGTIGYTFAALTPPYNEHWAVWAAVNFGTQQIVPAAGAIIDASCPFIRLPAAAYEAYVDGTGATLDSATGLLKVPQSSPWGIKTLEFVIGGVTYSLVPNAQWWPWHLNSQIGGADDMLYLLVVDGSKYPSTNYGTVLGRPFLQRFYTVLDTTYGQVGFATTSDTYDATN